MGRTDLDSGKFYAKVLLKEPLPLMMQESIAVFARGTGASGPVIWPDKENRMGKRAAGLPPEAYIAYPTEADRQAALMLRGVDERPRPAQILVAGQLRLSPGESPLPSGPAVLCRS